MRMITRSVGALSVHTALTCFEGQSACTLTHSCRANMSASCKKQLSRYSCANLVPLRMKWACILKNVLDCHRRVVGRTLPLSAALPTKQRLGSSNACSTILSKPPPYAQCLSSRIGRGTRRISVGCLSSSTASRPCCVHQDDEQAGRVVA